MGGDKYYDSLPLHQDISTALDNTHINDSRYHKDELRPNKSSNSMGRRGNTGEQSVGQYERNDYAESNSQADTGFGRFTDLVYPKLSKTHRNMCAHIFHAFFKPLFVSA